MKMTITEDPMSGDRTYILVMTQRDITLAPLDNMDLALIADVERNGGDSGHPIADALLALQTIAFRLEQDAVSKIPVSTVPA